jgi:hypothetical protein
VEAVRPWILGALALSLGLGVNGEGGLLIADPAGISNRTVRGRMEAVVYGIGHRYGEQTLRC